MRHIAEIVGWLVIFGVPLWVWTKHREVKFAKWIAASNREADEQQLAWIKEHQPSLYPVRLAEAEERWKDDVSRALLYVRSVERAKLEKERDRSDF